VVSARGTFSSQQCTLYALPNGAAACAVDYHPSGLGSSTRKDTLVAAYAGDGTYSASQGSVAVAVAAKGTPFISFDCAPATIHELGGTTCHSRVYAGASYNGDESSPVPSGKVSFTPTSTKGTLSVTSCTLVPFGSGGADCMTQYTAKTPGSDTRSDTITASYAGDTHFLAAKATTTVAVTPRPVPSVGIVCDPDPMTDVQTTTCTFIVQAPEETDIAPTGAVLTTATGHGTFTPAKCALVTSSTGLFDGRCSVTYKPSGAGSAPEATGSAYVPLPGRTYWSPAYDAVRVSLRVAEPVPPAV
jgi:hypothetical protein